MKKLLLLFVLLTFCSELKAQKLYLLCGQLIDGIGKSAQSEMTVVIEGNKITAINKGYAAGVTDGQVINLKNKTVMPGLIDCHVHLEHETTKNQLLRFTLTDADVAYRAS